MKLVEYKEIYGLYHRVKEIRPTYRLMLNRETGLVELYDDNFGGKCMTFSLPLTAEILDKINYSRIENANAIFRKIEEENVKNECKMLQNSVENTKRAISDIVYL